MKSNNPYKDSALSFLYKIIMQRLLLFLPDTLFILIDYFLFHRKFPNLRDPETFSEKIQWLKLHNGLNNYTKFVDKYEARTFVTKMIGKRYLVPWCGVWSKSEDIPFVTLPNQFVLKATHGSAYVYVCKDKSKISIPKLKKIVDTWLHEDFFRKTREPQYKGCIPRVICEKYLEDKNGELIDYKVFYFDGKPHLIEVVWGRFTDQKGDVYKDLKWKTQDISYIGVPLSKRVLHRPKNLNKLLELSGKLAKGFPFVRVDMYSVRGKIYFGELTFTPANGMERFDPPEVDYQFGKLINLSHYRNTNE